MSDLHAPAVLYLCHSCQDHSPESCGYPASDVRRMPGGTQLCEPCFKNGDDEGRWGDLSAVTSVEAMAAENAALREALSAANGYLLNAKIDLETGARKSTAITTIEGGLRRVRAALQETKP
jgi:hypothetical protein